MQKLLIEKNMRILELETELKQKKDIIKEFQVYKNQYHNNL